MPTEKEEWIITRYSYPSEIVEFLNTVFEIYEIRAKVGAANGIEFIVHTNEQNHHLPHIHAKYGDYEISIAIETGKVLAGNLRSKQNSIAQEWVKNNQAKLLNDWKTIAISATSSMTKSRLGWDD